MESVSFLKEKESGGHDKLHLALPPGRPLAGSTAGQDRLTFLMDGHVAADSRFRTGGRQPAAVMEITETNGRRGLLFVDLGDDAEIFRHNLELVENQAGNFDRRAVVLTHAHTHAGGKSIRPNSTRSDGLPHVWDHYGPLPVQGTNLADSCRSERINQTWRDAGLCDGKQTDLMPGLVPLQWSDGPSSRVHLLTYPIDPPEHGIPFAQMETVIAIRSGAGYIVYTTCSHMHRLEPGGTAPPLHGAYLVKAAIDDGRLEPGPIHTVVTGTCGLLRTFAIHGGKDHEGFLSAPLFLERLTALRDELGIRELYLSHCALGEEGNPVHMMFLDVFGDGLRLAYPGTSLEL